MKKRMAALLVAGALVGSGVALGSVNSEPAYAGGCSADYNNDTWTISFWNIACFPGGWLQPWMNYYRNDNDPRVYTAYGPTVTSGSTSASRPGGSYYISAGFN